MKVTKLGAFKGSDWRQRFVDALMKLRPELNPDAADELSDSQFIALSGLQPELAALEFVTNKPAGDASSAGNEPLAGGG